MLTTQVQIRNSFWENHPQFKRQGNEKQNSYNTDIRVSYCDYVESLHRDGQISEALADRATL